MNNLLLKHIPVRVAFRARKLKRKRTEQKFQVSGDFLNLSMKTHSNNISDCLVSCPQHALHLSAC